VSAETLASSFTFERVSKNPAIFDVEKLEWMNGVYIREMTPAQFFDRMAPWLVDAGLATLDDLESRRAWVETLAPLVSERVKRMDEVVPMVRFLFVESVEIDPAAATKVLGAPGALDALAAAREKLAGLADFSAAVIEEALRSLPEVVGVKPKVLFQSVRVAVTGATVSPPLFESLELLGRDRTLARLDEVLERGVDGLPAHP